MKNISRRSAKSIKGLKNKISQGRLKEHTVKIEIRY